MKKLWFAYLLCVSFSVTAERHPPNVIFVLADDLGYNEIGAYGQQKIHTPNLDKLAEQGMRFTQFYAGAPVCATSRSVLMTGQHAGHTRVRGNAFPEDNGRQELYAEDFTLAELFKQANYRTALIGKWGLGMNNTQGHPNEQGFDYFFGYLSQHHAHNFYPTFLWRNDLKVGLPNTVRPMGNGHLYGAGVAVDKKVYAPDLFIDEALSFIQQNRQQPFFLYYATNVPHSNNEATTIRRADGAEVPELGEYESTDWQLGSKRHAAMITRMDRDIGAMMEQVKQLGMEDNTIFIFSSDNGPHVDHAEPMDFFSPSAPLQGWKMELWEGGIRVPLIVRWPATVPANVVSNEVGYFGDFMATFADITGQPVPAGTDSQSLMPLWQQQTQNYKPHEYLYWEFKGRDTGVVALKDGRWKGIVRDEDPTRLALFDLAADVAEQRDVSQDHPELVEELWAYLRSARSESEHWPPIITF
ncbi:arylsulfatase [Alteromonas aestuariivivens]|uniref:arylsulfatase n=1 Tax=Alteromonas aestuariivivens TaxID=1938339 RepID=UPI0015F267B8|nr:arylsulfatase [Alteromonas aestuariivivens]